MVIMFQFVTYNLAAVIAMCPGKLERATKCGIFVIHDSGANMIAQYSFFLLFCSCPFL